MNRFAIGLVFLAACTQSVADEAQSFCTPLCRCLDSPLPGQQRDCTTACIADFETNPLGDLCLQCVAQHAQHCTTLIDDCNPVCAQAQATPLQSYGSTATSRIEDGQ
jgi:hypothetical protein